MAVCDTCNDSESVDGGRCPACGSLVHLEDMLQEVDTELHELYEADSAAQPIVNDGIRGQIYAARDHRNELISALNRANFLFARSQGSE